MARYLSPEWFAEVISGADPTTQNGSQPAVLEEPAVLEQVVEGTPYGTITYRVEVSAGGEPLVCWPVAGDAPDPDLRITCSWPTAVAVAKGELSTQHALAEGQLRCKGNLARIAQAASRLAGVDPVTAEIRSTTTF